MQQNNELSEKDNSMSVSFLKSPPAQNNSLQLSQLSEQKDVQQTPSKYHYGLGGPTFSPFYKAELAFQFDNTEYSDEKEENVQKPA